MTLSMEMGNDYAEVKELCQSHTKQVEKGELLHPPLIRDYDYFPLHDVCMQADSKEHMHNILHVGLYMFITQEQCILTDSIV